MQIQFRGLGPKPRLEFWERQPFTPGTESGPGPRDNRDSYERKVAEEAPGPPAEAGVYRRLAAAVLRYEIFPPDLVSGVLRRTPVAVGDTVGILFHAPGNIDLFFAARVLETFDGPTDSTFRTGFTYRTLRGHPELGEETFAVEKDLRTGAIRVSLKSWSRPGIWLARAGMPLVRWLQVRASHAALDHLAEVARRNTQR